MNNPAANDGGVVFLEPEDVLERLRVLKELVGSEITLYFPGEGTPANVEILGFMQNTAGNLKLHTVFTANQLDTIVAKVFGSAHIRDFVLCLTDKFQVLYGDDKFANTIARAVGQATSVPGDNSMTLIPPHILENMMVSEQVIRKTLLQNKWLCTVLLIHLTLTILTDNKPTPEKVKPK